MADLEIRTIKTEVRATGDFCLSGRAASYGVRSQNLGGFVEQIAPGAFTQSLKANPDVKCTFNHDPNQLLGRTKSGTLTLTDSAGGLDFRCQLDKTNTLHCNIYASVKRGDVDQCSFAFTVGDKGDDWADGAVDDKGQRCQLRTLRNVNLVDVSAVTYPAYNATGATQVSARALALAQKTTASDAERKAKADRLGKVIAGSDPTLPTLQATSDEARRSVARVQATKIGDAARREKAARLGAVIAEDEARESHRQKINRIMGINEVSPAKFVADLDRRAIGGGGLLYPYENLASAVSAQLPGQKLVGANSSQAFTKHSSGSKYTVPYTENNGKFSFGQASLGGHPEWLTDKDVS
jgi:uncharacterized protein